MQFNLSLLLAQILDTGNLNHVGFTALGFACSWAIRFVGRRRRRLHLHPEQARQVFRRKARKLVIMAFLAGRSPGLWFRLVYACQRPSEKHVLQIVMELRDLAEPSFALTFTDAISAALSRNDDHVCCSAADAQKRELEVLECLKAVIPANMQRLQFLLCASTSELATNIQAIYEGLMSQHAELVLKELQTSPIHEANGVKTEIQKEIDSLRRRLRCLGKKLMQMLEESRTGIRFLVQVHQPSTEDATSASQLPTETLHIGQADLLPSTHMPGWMRFVIVAGVLAILVLAGLQIALFWMLTH